ncbi:alpha/beta hydrolase family protein [Dietzia sp. UBA5065]|jgi:S-formylglutathione hydrolase FrmB|uniref:alpha/beta hydrolase n=1 Tax=Dietzia sp. UBA5065 TaxID=1946422 RepID=UPI0025C2E677|nr:alpha/beta hydrolase-fold protein [Dietzia sp. UBA5065]HMT48638.1 alpha/beta hydrolase-fold protein [Dietzia sp.]
MTIDRLLGTSLLDTPALVAVWVLVVGGVAGLVALGARTARPSRTGATGPGGPRRWWTRTLPACIGTAVAATATGGLLVEKVFRPFPDALPPAVYVWIAVGLFALILGAVAAVGGSRARRPWCVAGAVLAVISVVVGAGGHVNRMYAEYPTLGSPFGWSDHRTVSLAEVPGSTPATIGGDLPPGTPLDSVWTPPPTMPQRGAITEASIPGTASGFVARPAQIYLPPAYFTDPRPLLPVLVLLPGQPGTPTDWVVSGRLPVVADAFAARHAGLSPVVVVADPIGEPLGNTLCVDSGRGNARTYLAEDVPDWIHRNLQVDTGPRSMAIGGLSFGGTCALQMALSDPEVYPTFLDLSGQGEPTIGTRADTVDRFFGGDEAAFREHNPADVLAHRRFPGLAGAFVTGTSDSEYGPATRALYSAALAAGIDAHLSELPGGHSYAVWSAGLEHELPWLAQRMGLIR